ncbi:MAG: M23 family metallopeptidase [Anaerolineales bacterium]
MDNSWISAILPFGDLISATSNTSSSSNDSSAKTDGNSASITQNDFRELLTIMLLSNLASSSSSTSESGSLGIGSLIAPIMLSLLEKMMSNQVESPAPAAQPKTETKEAEPVNSPRGMPIKGALTQSAHPGHIALDFGAPVGTPVKATMDGKVIYAGWNNEGYGNLVIVENGPYLTYFAHLSKIPVKVGEKVKAGMVIGYSGNTGNSTGPHLHYEVRKNGVQIDPAPFTLTLGG